MQTEVLLEELPQLLRELGVTTMLDLPCGDFFWMKSVDLGEIDYVGADIVPDAVERNQQLFAGANRRFKTLDVTTDSLPKVDLVLCRDCLVHFSDRDIVRAVSNLRRSGSRYLLTTTYIDRALNRNIATGDWRPLNLEREPFSFPPPLRLIDEKCTEEGGRFSDKSLALWKLDSLPTARL
ncbi:MAG: class I SAM-dependent methyltransferase [Actinomycetota bacterium]